MAERIVHFLAIVLTALILAPGGAHLFAMSAKVRMDQSAYFTVQQIYAGWALFAAPIFAVVVLDGVLAWMVRGEPLRFWLTAAAGAAIVLSLVLFFVLVFPGNQATQNWTQPIPEWSAYRGRWEIGHAINAVITFASLCLLTAAALSRSAPGSP
jgi:hypothetical protein